MMHIGGDEFTDHASLANLYSFYFRWVNTIYGCNSLSGKLSFSCVVGPLYVCDATIGIPVAISPTNISLSLQLMRISF